MKIERVYRNIKMKKIKTFFESYTRKLHEIVTPWRSNELLGNL